MTNEKIQTLSYEATEKIVGGVGVGGIGFVIQSAMSGKWAVPVFVLEDGNLTADLVRFDDDVYMSHAYQRALEYAQGPDAPTEAKVDIEDFQHFLALLTSQQQMSRYLRKGYPTIVYQNIYTK